MKIQNLFIYSILAIGLISVPSLLDTVQAQVNMTNTTSSSVQNQTAQSANQTAQSANQTAQSANQTAQTAANQTAQNSQNQTMSKETQALMELDIPGIKDQLMNTKESLLNNNTEEALAGISDVEIQLLLLPHKPSFVGDIQTIKNSIAKSDINKALDDITKVQTGIVKAETEKLKAQIANPQLLDSQQNNDAQDGEDN